MKDAKKTVPNFNIAGIDREIPNPDKPEPKRYEDKKMITKARK